MKWVKVIPLGQLDPEKSYSIGRTWGGRSGYDILLRGKNMKLIWGGKPGIGVRYKGTETLKSDIAKLQTKAHQDCKIEAIEVPADTIIHRTSQKELSKSTAIARGMSRKAPRLIRSTTTTRKAGTFPTR